MKSVAGFRGLDGKLSKELDPDNKAPSRVIAFQVPNNTDVGKWMGRYWGNRIKDNPSGWTHEGSKHAHKEVLIVDQNGKTLLRQPVFDATKAE